MKIWKNALLFYLGGSGYMALECLWRGWSHGSMFLAGGTAFLLIGRLGAKLPRLPRPLRALFGAGVITAVELGAGLLCNRTYCVWDYRDRVGNLWGQICPLYSALWIPVAFIAGWIYEKADAHIQARTDTRS